ncbi:MAG: hypothetical protein QGH07_09560, partial [Alphaproteobacteria bacterium]|nr:hypothetical protein [Alphaproteobacteria bacterium]
MRFILFNLVVGAAVVYLISGNAGDTVRSAGFSETTASVIEDIGDKARATVAKAVEKTPNGATPAEENPKPKAVAKTHETSATAMKTPELKKTVPQLE